jgi:pimeloyl-ACP methyl ester carboxylesterase
MNVMLRGLKLACGLACCALATAQAQTAPVGAVQSDQFRTVYVRLGGNDSEGLLYEPMRAGANARIALVYSHPDGNTFDRPIGREMASRGYRVLMVNYRGSDDTPEAYAPSISRGVTYVRTLPGVERVVIVGHSGGGHLVAFYQNVAEHGPAACQGREKLYPCRGDELMGLAKPDGIVLLDPTLGAFHQMSAVDPAVGGKVRTPALDMFAAANGFDPAGKRAHYSPEFARRFYAAQAARNARIVDNALARLSAIERGSGEFKDDEPIVIPGMGVNAAGARLYQPDTTFVAHTKKPHLLLKADGSEAEVLVRSVRAPAAQLALGSLRVMSQDTTVRRFLANSAIRTAPGFAITDDDIVGVDWASAMTSTPANAEGISVPALLMTMSCHYLVVPGEIIFEHLGSKDKTYASVEGAAHVFTPCRPEYGDTAKRLFNYLDRWLTEPGRFSSAQGGVQ